MDAGAPPSHSAPTAPAERAPTAQARQQPAPLPAGPFREGQVIGGAYAIRAVLGAGGMGVVYDAHDEGLDRAVAIKAPLLPTLGAALRKEAQAMAAVHHPNVVAIHAVSREGDVDFIVMERVFGMTLEDRIIEAWEAQRPIPLEEAIALLVAITDAIGAIHRAGVTHRDVKSANVMLSGERVVLTDFGLVTPEVTVHPGGPIAGSADYMAPELILGAVEQGLGPMVDLYALGVLAFEVLASRRPYEACAPGAVMLAHVKETVPDVRAFRRDTPDDLAHLIAELTAKAPEDRPASADVVLWRLDAIKADLPTPSLDRARAPLSVIIVDDDAGTCSALRRTLQAALPGLRAETFTDGTRALARIQREPPDVVVVDLEMPGMNGVELFMALDALPARARPVMIAMSAKASQGDVALLEDLGVQAFVDKNAGFAARMCAVLGDVRRSRPPTRHSRRPTRA
jgi:serine/threonine-protein kinase